MGDRDELERAYLDSVAEGYDHKILSALHADVTNPLFEFGKAIPNIQTLQVIDASCGTRSLLPFLAATFKEVWGVDWSARCQRLQRRGAGI